MPESLAEFADGRRKKWTGPAWVTTIPEYDEVVAAYKSGIDLTTIERWLIDVKGYSPDDCNHARLSWLYKNVPR